MLAVCTDMNQTRDVCATPYYHSPHYYLTLVIMGIMVLWLGMTLSSPDAYCFIHTYKIHFNIQWNFITIQ